MKHRNNSQEPPEKAVKKHRFRRNWKEIRGHINDIFLESELSPLNKANHAEWHESNGQKYLEINASDHYNLGVLEGQELGPKIRALKIIIRAISVATRSRGYTYKRFLEMAKAYEEAIPDEFLRDRGYGTVIDEIQGMADVLRGISFEDILLQNCFIDIVYGELIPFGSKIPQEYEFGCTSFGAVKLLDTNSEDTKSYPQVFIGQNFDFNITFKPTLSFVLHKVANLPKIFSLRMGGYLALPMGVNEWGHRACVNVVKSNVSGIYTMPSGILTRTAFMYGRDVESAYQIVFDQPAPNSYNIMLADPQNLISCEVLPTMHIRYDVDSWFTSSNTFKEESLQNNLISPQYSKERQRLADEMMAAAYRKGIESRDIIKILATKPTICRNPVNPAESRTLAFITNEYFGIGNPADDSRGFIPLELQVREDAGQAK